MIKSPICFDKQITEWDSSCDVDEVRLDRYKTQQLLEIITGLGCCLAITAEPNDARISIHISLENPSIRSIRFCSPQAKTSVVKPVG